MNSKANMNKSTQRLRRQAIDALLKGRHASVGGKTTAARAKNMLQIAAAYSWDELLREPGIGPVIAKEIQLWLSEQGASLRS